MNMNLDEMLQEALSDFEEDDEEERLHEEETKSHLQQEGNLTHSGEGLENSTSSPNSSGTGVNNNNSTPDPQLHEQMDSMLNQVFSEEFDESSLTNLMKDLTGDFDSTKNMFQDMIDEITKNPDQAAEFTNFVNVFVEQLISKEFLGETMGELSTKFPKWLEENKGSLSESQYQAHEKQLTVVKSLVTQLEKGPDDKEKILTLMEELHVHGPLPQGLLANSKNPLPNFGPNADPSQCLLQ